jgi:hypothetical protein
MSQIATINNNDQEGEQDMERDCGDVSGYFVQFEMKDLKERKRILMKKSKDDKYLKDISEYLQFAVNRDNADALVRGIVEGLYLQKITNKQLEILIENLKVEGNVDRFICGFREFHALGFTPYI